LHNSMNQFLVLILGFDKLPLKLLEQSRASRWVKPSNSKLFPSNFKMVMFKVTCPMV
jgi:hypothetical protein